MPSSKLLWPLFAALALAASLAVTYAHQLASGGADLAGDILDGRLADMLQLHWLRVLQGREAWNQPGIFAPTPDTLGFNDGYLLFGLLQAAFHALGANVFLAAELGGVVFRIAGFAGIYALGREAFGLQRHWALLAAAIGVMSNGLHLQQGHEQLFTAYLAPVVAALALHAARRAREGRTRAATLEASVAALLFSFWLLTAFYMLWFAVFFACIVAVVAAARAPRQVARTLRAGAGAWLALPGAILLLGLVPFALVYGPAERLAGVHSWAEAYSFTLDPLDLVHVLPGNLLAGWLDRGAASLFGPAVTEGGEHAVGLPPLLWILAGLGIWLAVTRRGPPGAALLAPVAIAFCISILLAMHFGKHTGWRPVFQLVPGARALRVVCRFMLLLGLVAGLLAAVGLQWLAARRRVPPALLLIAAVLLLAEEINDGAATDIHPAEEQAFLHHLGPPPAACRSFVVSRPRDLPGYGGGVVPSLLLNVDATTVAEMTGLPTPFGLDTFIPPGLDLIMFDQAAWQRFPALVHAAELTAGPGVCDLDLRLGQWRVARPAIATLAPHATIGFDHGGGSGTLVAQGWSDDGGTTRWTVGPTAALVFRWTRPAPLVLHVHARTGFTARHPSRIEVVANGIPLASWGPDTRLLDHVLRIPAAAIGADGLVRLGFAISGAISPAEAGLSIDSRRLGIQVFAIAAE